MVRAKNYETMSTFVKVMQEKLWPLFFRTRCSCKFPRVYMCQKNIKNIESRQVIAMKTVCSFFGPLGIWATVPDPHYISTYYF